MEHPDAGRGRLATRAARWNRKLHRIGALAIALPLAVVIGSGLLLLLKKDVAWIQPSTRSGSAAAPALPFDAILEAVRRVPEAQVAGWDDVDRLDVRPGKGVVKVRCQNRWEVQLDTSTGAVLQSAYRRSDLIESLHDGSFFHPRAKLWVFLPAGLILAALWGTGLYLFALPHLIKRRRKQRAHVRDLTQPGDRR